MVQIDPIVAYSSQACFFCLSFLLKMQSRHFLVMSDQHAVHLDSFFTHLDVCSFDVISSNGTRKYRKTRLALDY